MMKGKNRSEGLLFQESRIILIEYKIQGMIDYRTVQLTKNLAPAVKILMESFEDRYDDIVTLLDLRLSNNGLVLETKDIEELADYYISSELEDV